MLLLIFFQFILPKSILEETENKSRMINKV